MVNNALNEGKGKRKPIDATVGGLVWVQRKNGSWWPGQIVGLDELPEDGSGSGSLRAGTPIKLLGRDDPCLDWYDLETTKVVKAFRCGEHETCIEKAKVSAPKLLKRSSKIPRREIAIFRALEIENNSLNKNCPNFADSELTSACEDNSNSTQEASRSGITYEETNGSTCLKGQHHHGKRRTPLDSDDEGYEGFRRMKGLNELGVGSNRKAGVLALACPVNGTQATNVKEVGTLANGGSLLSLKIKRSQVIQTDKLWNRKYRQHPLTNVLENTTMVPVQIICDEFANPSERPDSISLYESEDDSEYVSEDDSEVKDTELLSPHLLEAYSSDTQFDVPFIDEEPNSSGFFPVCHLPGAFKGNSSHNEHAFVNQKVEQGVSRWQSKGKRKARYLSKNADLSNSASLHGLLSGFPSMRNRFSVPSSFQRSSFPYTQMIQPHFYCSEFPNVPSLYEVEVTVEASRPPVRFVPYVSLVSKVSGQPITGHPIVVEAFEDGFCDTYLSDESYELDDESARTNVVAKPEKHETKRVKFWPHFSHRKGKTNKSKGRRGSSSRKAKTRKLSSLISPQKLQSEKGKTLIQVSKGPTLACVPLKIVFSRLNEALSGSRSAHRSLSFNYT